MADRADPLSIKIPGRRRNSVWYQHHQAIDWHGVLSPRRLCGVFHISLEELAHVGKCADPLHCYVCCYCVELPFGEPNATEPGGQLA